MGRINTGGRSVRVDVALSPELHGAAERAAEIRGVNLSELVRQAVAAFIGRPELAGELKPGRRWPEDPKKRTQKKPPAKPKRKGGKKPERK